MSPFVFNPDKHFLGKPCKQGHAGYRFKSSPGICCECKPIRNDYLTDYNKLRKTRPASLATSLFLACKHRQKRDNPDAPFDLTKEWILERIEAGVCQVTKLPFSLELTVTNKRPFAPSIDRIDPNKFYTKDNCQVVCFIYNVAKGEFSNSDVITLANAVCKIH